MFRCDSTDNCVPSDGVSGEVNYPIRATTFFVSSCVSTGADGVCGTSDDIPGLKKVWLRPDGTVAKSTVIEGVANMQVRYGVDSNDDGLPDQYIDSSSIHFKNKTHWKKWSQVRSVRIWLLMRSNAPEAGYVAAKSSYTLANDTTTAAGGYRYQTFNLTVSLRNS